MTKGTNLRYHEVVWHSKPVFISGLSPSRYNSELGFQIFTKQWLDSEPREFRYHHSANEYRGKGHYGAAAGRSASIAGQSRGFPDWLILGANRSLAIELKLPKGAVSPDQQDWLDHFAKIGWVAEVVRSFERFREIVLDSNTKTP